MSTTATPVYLAPEGARVAHRYPSAKGGKSACRRATIKQSAAVVAYTDDPQPPVARCKVCEAQA
jgi:hypothetical protein